MKLEKIISSFLAAGVLCIPATHAFAQNLITNPGFETAPAAGGDHLQGSGTATAYYANSFASGSTQSIQNWTFGYDGTVATSGGSAAQVEWFKAGTAASTAYTWNATPTHGGTYAIELNSDAAKGRMYVQPTLTTGLVIGATYTLSFWVSPERNWFTGSSVTNISGEVTVGGSSALTFSVAAPASSGTSIWTQKSVNFVATSTNPVIRIYDGVYVSGSSSNYDPGTGRQSSNDLNLDDFSLTRVTPEPATWASAFLLLGLVGWTERRRLKTMPSWLNALLRR